MESFISHRLKEFFEKNKINKASFSEKHNVHRTSIYNYLNGDNQPTLIFLEHLLNDYPSLNMEWLFRGIGPMMLENVENNVHESTLKYTTKCKECELKDKIIISLLDKEQKIKSELNQCMVELQKFKSSEPKEKRKAG